MLGDRDRERLRRALKNVAVIGSICILHSLFMLLLGIWLLRARSKRNRSKPVKLKSEQES